MSNTVGDLSHTNSSAIQLLARNKLRHLLVEVLGLSVRVIHVLLDVGVELLVSETAELGSTVNTVLLSRTDNTTGDNDGNLADAADVRVQPAVGDFLLVERSRE